MSASRCRGSRSRSVAGTTRSSGSATSPAGARSNSGARRRRSPPSGTARPEPTGWRSEVPPEEHAVTLTAPARPVMPPSDHTPRPYRGPSKPEVLALRRQYCHPSTFLYYREPLMVVEGFMQYLYDETGRRYLDMFAGMVTVSCGHSHPKVVARMKDQLDLITHTTTIYLHPNFPAMAKKLAGKMPSGLDVTYFVNSGSEANDLAVLMARAFTGHNDSVGV